MTVVKRLNNVWTRSAVVAGGLGYVYAVNPQQPGKYPSCFVYALSGMYCPGCGLLRSTHNLLHGNIAAALQQNVIVTALWLTAIVVGVVWLVTRLTRDRPTLLFRTIPPPMAWAGVIVVVVFTTLRNLPGFEMLAPY